VSFSDNFQTVVPIILAVWVNIYYVRDREMYVLPMSEEMRKIAVKCLTVYRSAIFALKSDIQFIKR
jgi:hypothetical protein